MSDEGTRQAHPTGACAARTADVERCSRDWARSVVTPQGTRSRTWRRWRGGPASSGRSWSSCAGPTQRTTCTGPRVAARGLFLRAAPISVAEALRERLYGAVDTVVFTSATLRTGQLVRVLLPAGGPPRRRGRGRRAADPARRPVVVRLRPPVGAVPAARPARAARARLRRGGRGGDRAPGRGDRRPRLRPLHLAPEHGAGARAPRRAARRTRCCSRARRRSRCCSTPSSRTPSVLFASASFWEGVDVPGDALLAGGARQAAVRLARRTRWWPRASRRWRQSGREPFSSYQLPEAALALRQGFGRLIRTRTDRGIVALLDVRVGRKAYGRQLLAGLPPARRFKEIGPLAEWFQSGEPREPG